MSPRLELELVLAAVAAIVLVVSALSKDGERRRGAAVALAWLVPGAGHVFLGNWKKGLFLFGLLAATYVFGLWIVGFRSVSFDNNPFYYVGQYGSGLTFLLSRLLGQVPAYPRPDMHPNWHDPGLLYVCVVGLLNLVLMLNVLEVKLEATAKAPAPAPSTVVPPPPTPAPEKTA